jgi:hypothetical protein
MNLRKHTERIKRLVAEGRITDKGLNKAVAKGLLTGQERADIAKSKPSPPKANP